MPRKNGGMTNDSPADDVEMDAETLRLITEAPEDWEFETVAEESPTHVFFENIGDKFIGQFKGIETITPGNGKDEPFDLLIFRGRDGNRYSVTPGYKLERAFKEIDVDAWCRITYVANIPTGRAEPMKDYRVDVRK